MQYQMKGGGGKGGANYSCIPTLFYPLLMETAEAAALLLMSICFYSSLSSSSFYFIRISLTWKYPVGLLLLLLLLLLEVIHWAMAMPPPPLQNDDEFLLLPLPFHILMRLLQLQIVAELRECPQQFRDRPLGVG